MVKKNFFTIFTKRKKGVLTSQVDYLHPEQKERVYICSRDWRMAISMMVFPQASRLSLEKNIPVLRFDDLMALSCGSFPPVHLPPGRIRNVTRSSRDQKETIFGICGRCLSLYLSYPCLLLYCQAKSTVRLSQVTLYETASFPPACVPPWTRTEKGREPNEEKTFFVPSPIKDSSLQVLLKNEGMCFDSPGD